MDHYWITIESLWITIDHYGSVWTNGIKTFLIAVALCVSVDVAGVQCTLLLIWTLWLKNGWWTGGL